MDYIVKAYKDWKLHSQFQEIVPDMDDTEFMFNEKQSIRDSSRTLKRYGSTCCNSLRNNETLIQHIVEKTDTLQGIALKYGCTTEQIRRANRLFASDSLFLRQFLLVPVEKNSPYYPQVGSDPLTAFDAVLATPPGTPDSNGQREAHNNANNLSQAANIYNSSGNSSSENSNSGSSSSCNTSGSSSGGPGPRSSGSQQNQRPYSIAGELLVVQAGDEDPAMINSQGGCNGKQSKSLDSVAAMTPEEENRKCMNDFLNKIDNTISESRKYVERSKDLVTSQSDADICISASADIFPQRRHPLNNSYKTNNNDRPAQFQRLSSNGSGTSNSDTAHLLNTTQTRRVQNSLKRLEKQQDDFFEL
ncbi:myb-like protein H isoform X1 [Drosophila bipectinata]|uniref:myb-like protein H isoform X1 n=2 Tax=Drosophila bipectinata TaxID=42026 RepID=UPI001C8A90AF|nr:sericin-2 isoform X1 [Drosophila bipectinata]